MHQWCYGNQPSGCEVARPARTELPGFTSHKKILPLLARHAEVRRRRAEQGDGRGEESRNAIPVFATVAPTAILVPMPTLEINATQPWLISQTRNVAEAGRRLSAVEELEAVVFANLQQSKG